MITLLFCAEGALSQPLLYLSLYFKEHRDVYYDLLQSMRMNGDWETWIDFFLTGVKNTADQAVNTARDLLGLFASNDRRLQDLGRSAGSAIRAHHALQSSPMLSARVLAQKTGLSEMTGGTTLRQLEDLGIVREITGAKYGRIYAYQQYLDILSEGTAPIN